MDLASLFIFNRLFFNSFTITEKITQMVQTVPIYPPIVSPIINILSSVVPLLQLMN